MGKSGAGARTLPWSQSRSQGMGVGALGLDQGCQSPPRTKAETTDYSHSVEVEVMAEMRWLGKVHEGGGISAGP